MSQEALHQSHWQTVMQMMRGYRVAHLLITCAELDIFRQLAGGRFVGTDLVAVLIPGSGEYASDVEEDTPLRLTPGGGPGLSVANPYRPNTMILLDPGAVQKTEVAVYNIHGQRVRTLLDGVIGPQPSVLRWDGRTGAGDHVASGIYYLRAQVGQDELNRKILLIK